MLNKFLANTKADGVTEFIHNYLFYKMFYTKRTKVGVLFE